MTGNPLNADSASEGLWLIILIALCLVPALRGGTIPNRADNLAIDGRHGMRPVTDVRHLSFIATLDNMQRLATDKHIDLTLGQSARPGKERGYKVLIGHARQTVVL